MLRVGIVRVEVEFLPSLFHVFALLFSFFIAFNLHTLLLKPKCHMQRAFHTANYGLICQFYFQFSGLSISALSNLQRAFWTLKMFANVIWLIRNNRKHNSE